MEIKNINLLIIVLLTAFTLASCYPGELESIEDYDVVITQYDTSFNFDVQKYYLLPDTVTIISDDEFYEKEPEEITLDEAIIDEIEFQMDQAGYTMLMPADTADEEKMNQAVVILTSRSTVSHINYYYDYFYYGRDYWRWYSGFNYYYPGYYWNYYYPWGYPVSYSSSYTTGTVIIEMIDPLNPFQVDEENGEVSYNVRWMAILNGLAESSYENTTERTIEGIEQAFSQSQYLY